MKNFTNEEILNYFKKGILSVDSHNNKISQYHVPYNRGHHYLQESMIPCLLPSITNPKGINIENVGRYLSNSKIYYLLPGYFLNENFNYISTPDTDTLLEKWYEVVKANLRDNKLYCYEEEQIINANTIARELYGLIYFNQFKNNGILEKVKNPLHKEFWEVYLEARHDYEIMSERYGIDSLVLEYPKERKNLEKKIVSLVESLEDLEQLGEVILQQKKYRKLEKQEKELYSSVLNHIVPKRSLKKLTNIQSFYIDSIFMGSCTPDEIIKNLKSLEFCEFKIVKNVYLKLFNTSKNKRILDYIEPILIENKVISKNVEKENLFEDKTNTVIYRKSLNLNLKVLREKANNDIYVALNLLEIVIINEEKNNNNLKIKLNINEDINKAEMIIESTVEEDVMNFRNKLNIYIKETFNKEALGDLWAKISKRAGRTRIIHSQNEDYQKMFEKLSLPFLINNNLTINEKNKKKLKKI